MTDLDLDALEATARKARPGPWELCEESPSMGGPNYTIRQAGVAGILMSGYVYGHGTGMAEHVVAFDPPTSLALIAELREAEAAIENASHIHGPRKVWEGDRAYTVVCTACITEHYPCATVRTLARYKPTTQEGEQT